MESLLHFIISIQLTVGPCTAAAQLGLVPNGAQSAVLCVYMPTMLAYTQSPALEVALDEIMNDYRDLVRGWDQEPVR